MVLADFGDFTVRVLCVVFVVAVSFFCEEGVLRRDISLLYLRGVVADIIYVLPPFAGRISV